MADADLHHPSIVRPLGAGVEGTIAFAASEYIAAESLDVGLKHYAPAPLDRVLPFITQLAGAIDFARTVGIGLGALHPRDIFVTPDEARLTGFGVVQALELLGVRAPVRRPYTAPERVAGGEWDVRADVYSLGAIAFELLTARRPVGPDVADLGNTAGAHLDAAAHAIARALADDPAHRYPSALAFAAALEAAAHAEQTTSASEHVQEVAGTSAAMASPPVDREPAGHARMLVVEPDVEIERDEDEAEIQLREREPFAHETEDDHAESGAESLPAILAEPESEPEPAAEPEFRFAEPEDQQTAEPSLFDLETELDREPRPRDQSHEPTIQEEPPPPAVFPPPPEEAPTPISGHAPPPRREPPPIGRRPRPVFLPVALTLLLGLFVGFLAGYLVGSRETGGATTSSISETTAERSGATALPSPGASERSAAQARPAPQTARSTQQAARPAARAPASRSASAPSRPAPPPAAARGRLMVRSTPAGAQVFVNGRRRGTTPLAIRDLTPGTYNLRVVRRGFEEQARKVTVNSAGVREVNLRLEPSQPAPPVSFTGSLYVDSRPRGARVFVDGTAVGTTPMQASDIRAGAHVVRLELKDHRTWTASTRVVAGEVTRVTGSLERQQ